MFRESVAKPSSNPRIAWRNALLWGLTSIIPFLAASPSSASSHREAPLVTAYPKLDATDFYMFRSYEPGRDQFVTFVANYYPGQDPNSGPNYFQLDGAGVYEIKVDNSGDGIEDITFQFRFANLRKNLTVPVNGLNVLVPLTNIGQIGRNGVSSDVPNLNVQESYSVTMVRNANGGSSSTLTNPVTGATRFAKPVDNIGFKTLPAYDAYANQHIYEITFPGCANGRVFVGQRKDSFVVNLGAAFDLLNITNPIGEQFANSARDDLADKNVTSIALEVPIACLRGTSGEVIGAWTSSLRPVSGTVNTSQVESVAEALTYNPPYFQVSRLGMPLVNELVIGLRDKDTFNGSQPRDDANFLGYVTTPTFPAIVEIVFGPAGVKAPTLFPRTDLVATYLTGLPGLNQPANVKPSEMLRLNTGIQVVPANLQNRLGVISNDVAGFPNGRRPGDDVVDITLRVAMGRLITLGLYGTPGQAPSGNLDFTDGALVNASFFDTKFPYLRTPIAGSRGAAQPSVPTPPNAVLGTPNTVSAGP